MWVNYYATACRTECIQRGNRPLIIDSKVGSKPFTMPNIEFLIVGGENEGDELIIMDSSAIYEALDYQWIVNGTAVDKATLPYYTIRAQDVGKEIQCAFGRVRYLGDNSFVEGVLTCDNYLHPSIVVEC